MEIVIGESGGEFKRRMRRTGRQRGMRTDEAFSAGIV